MVLQMNTVPNDLARTIAELYGAEGVKWLSRLPSIIADCAQRWSLRVMAPFESLSYHYVAPAIRVDGTEVVLKVGIPTRELSAEVEALRLFNGQGAVQLIDVNIDQGALLVERLKPGTPLSSLVDDAQATSIAARVMRQLWRPVPPDHPFSTVAVRSKWVNCVRLEFSLLFILWTTLLQPAVSK